MNLLILTLLFNATTQPVDSLKVRTSAITTSEDRIVYSYGMDSYSVGFNKNSISTNTVEENIDVSSGGLTLNIKLTSLPMRGNKTYDVYLTYKGSPISASEVYGQDYGWDGCLGYVEEKIDDNECIINADMGNCGLGWNIMPGEFSFRDWPVPRSSAGAGVVYEGFLNLNGGRSYSMLAGGTGGTPPGRWYTVDKREDLLLDGIFGAGEGYNNATLYTPEYDYFFGEYGSWPLDDVSDWTTGDRIFVLLTKITDKNGNQVTVDWHEPEHVVGICGAGVVITSNRIPEKITTPTDECNFYRQEIIPDGSRLWNFYTIERLEEDVNGDLFTVRFYYEKENLPDAFEYWYGHEVVLLDSIVFLKNGTKVKPSYRFFYDRNNGELIRFITPDGAEYSYEYESVKGDCAGGRTEYRRIKRKEVVLPDDSETLVYEYRYAGGTDIMASSVGERQGADGSWSHNNNVYDAFTFYPMYKKCAVILPEGDSVVNWNIDNTYRTEQLEQYLGGAKQQHVYPDYLGSFYGKPYRIVKYDKDAGAVEMERLYWTMSEEVNRTGYYYYDLHPVLRYKITQKNPHDTIIDGTDNNLILYENTEYDKYDNKKKYQFLGEIEYIGTEAVTVEYNGWETWTDKKGRLLYNDKDPEDSWVVEQEFKHEADTTYIREVFDCGVGCVQVREHLLVHLLTSKGKYTISGEKIDSTELEYDLYLTEDFSFVPIPLFDKENYGRDFNIRGNLNRKTEWINEDETRSQEYRYDFCGNLRRMEDYRGHDYDFWYCFPANVFPQNKYYPVAGLSEHFVFDNEGNLIKFKDMNNVSRHFEYDCFGRLTLDTIDGGDKLNKYEYYDFEHWAREWSYFSASTADVTIYYYDELGRLKKTTQPSLSVKEIIKEFFYDKNGNLNKETVPRFSSAVQVDTVIKKFDVLNRVTQIEYPQSASVDPGFEIVEYEYNGDTTDVFDELSKQTTLINDASGNLIEVIDALGNYTDYYYDANGNLTEIVDTEEKSTEFKYNWLGQLLKTTGPDRGVDTFAYNKSGKMIYHRLNSGDEIIFQHDQLDRITRKLVNSTEAETYYYDSYTNIGDTSYTPPSGLNYPKGRLTGFQNSSVREVYFYDKFGNLAQKKVVSLTPYGKEQDFKYSYDLKGRITQLEHPDNYKVNYGYDQFGNISSTTIGGNTSVTLSSTAAGLLSGVHFPGGITDTFAYKPRNWMSWMEIKGISNPYWRQFLYNRRGELRYENGSQYLSAEYEYDPIGRLTREGREQDGMAPYLHTFTYDSVGNRTSVNGHTYNYIYGTNKLSYDAEFNYSYFYDANGRVNQITPVVDEIRYDVDGNMSFLSYLMGAENVYEYSYKGNQRIRQKIRRCPGGTTEIFNYLYDDAGNLVLVDDDSPNILENPGFETGNYAPEWVAWSGDGNYNWTVTSENSQEGKYSLYSPSYKSTSSMELLIQNHSLAEVSDTFTVSVWVKTVFLTGGVKIMVDFWDDEWGYLGGKSSNTITLNNNWTKLSVTINPGDIPSGAVNFKFNIVRKKGQGKLWVDNARCESGTERTPEIRYIYAGNRLLATENDGNLYFYHLDRIGSPIMLTNKSGSIVKQKVYEAFGNLKWQSGTYSDNREFTGKEKDPTGFHYFGARYYSGDIGRFLSPDPHTLNPKNIELSDPQVLNPYVYSRNNPIQYKDPNGKYYVDAFTGQIVKPNTVYETMMNLMPAILGGKDLAVPFYKGGGDELVDVLRVGPSTKVRVESPFKGKGYMEYPFMQYKASPFVAGGKLGLIGVQSIGREFGTGKNVLQLNIKATKSLGKVEVEGVEGEKILEEEVMTLTGTKDQLETQLDTWGYELYQENENFDSWEVREKEKR